MNTRILRNILLAATGIALGATFMINAHTRAAAPDQRNDMTTRSTDTPRYSPAGYDITPLPQAEIQLLAAKLTPEQRRIMLDKGTERPFCGNLLDNKKQGMYCCALCYLPLFTSNHKFNSGTGWPSFFSPFDEAHVATETDRSHGMVRTEILCARCDSHLGHVFDDGPRPTGLRFCVNSESLVFFENGEELPLGAKPVQTAEAFFAGGCFWGIEHHFEHLPGVLDAVSGYQGGHTQNPTYRDVLSKTTGHAEVVKVTYDPNRISYRTLLRAFFAMHDPTQLNRQGPDIGPQYRSAIFAADENELEQARAYIRTLEEADFYNKPIVTQIALVTDNKFYEAEEYHQDYVVRTGRACHAMRPLSDMPE